MVILILSGLILSVLVTINLVNVYYGPYLRKEINPNSYPLVSVLVPARNEQENIRRCLKSLLAQNYPHFEIIILDDESDDDTSNIVRSMSTRLNNIQLITGKKLPDNWVGKNWACWQ